MLTDIAEVEKWLRCSDILDYYIDENGKVSVKGNVDLSNEKLYDIPVQFESVSGEFNIFNNNLKSLVGCPTKVGGGFNCKKNELTSLVGGPQMVGRFYDCDANFLTTLEGAPQIIGSEDISWFFSCSGNKLTTFQYAPRTIWGNLYCNENSFPTLIGISDHIKLIAGAIYIDNNHYVKSGGLELLLIEKLKEINHQSDPPYNVPLSLINDFIKNNKQNQIFKCQEILIESGYSAFAEM